MNAVSSAIKLLAKRVEALPLIQRKIFEFIVDLLLPFRSINDQLQLRKLLKSSHLSNNRMEKDNGWAKFEFDAEVTKHLVSVANEVKNDFIGMSNKQINKKEYLQQIANIESLSRSHPEVLRFAVQLSLLKTVGDYLGKFPILHDVSVFYSPPQKRENHSDKWKGSQLFHRDGGGTRCLKLWLLCEPVNYENGPTTILPSLISDEVCKKLSYVPGRKFESDEPLTNYLGDTVSLVGPAGSWFGTDTDRCLHFGSRTTQTSSRLVMMFHYVDRNSVYYMPIIRRNYLQNRKIELLNLGENFFSRRVLRYLL